MKKQVNRLREVTFETELGATIKLTAKGYSKQSVTVSGSAEGPKKYTMDGTVIPIFECDKKSFPGDITVAVSTYDVLAIKKSLFGMKVLELDSL
jgi:hypothetical protein